MATLLCLIGRFLLDFLFSFFLFLFFLFCFSHSMWVWSWGINVSHSRRPHRLLRSPTLCGAAAAASAPSDVKTPLALWKHTGLESQIKPTGRQAGLKRLWEVTSYDTKPGETQENLYCNRIQSNLHSHPLSDTVTGNIQGYWGIQCSVRQSGGLKLEA